MLTIHQIAKLIVDSDFDGSPGSERYQIAIEHEEKTLRESAFIDWDKVYYVKVPVQREY